MQTITLDQGLVERLQVEFNTTNIKEAIWKLYQFYQESKRDGGVIEVISPDDPDYQIVKNGIKEYREHPERFGSMNDIDWD